MTEVVAKKPTAKARAKQRDVLLYLPPSLYKAAKAEIRSQGLTVRDWVIKKLTEELEKGPRWRAFLHEEGNRPEAKQRGVAAKKDK